MMKKEKNEKNTQKNKKSKKNTNSAKAGSKAPVAKRGWVFHGAQLVYFQPSD
jgi:hypothetical protein